MTGRIKKVIIRDVGSYGFIVDEDGEERYFAFSSFLSPGEPKAGQVVEFDPFHGGLNGQGLRARHITVIK